MKISPCNGESLARLLPLAREFARAAALPGGFSDRVWLATWRQFIAMKVGVVLVAWDGDMPMGWISGVIHPDPNNGDLVATEAAWFVSPEARGGKVGIKLLEAWEEWGRAQGAVRCTMAHLSHMEAAALRTFYKRRGYHETETHHTKEL